MSLRKLTIAYVTGGTCSGKSTFLQYAKGVGGDSVGLVEVGKMMRAKYPPEYFKGMAAPEHTQDEAWEMFMTRLRELLGDDRVTLILVDGQPRDVPQALNICGLEVESDFQYVEQRYVLMYCGDAEQLERARVRHIRHADPDGFEDFDYDGFNLTQSRIQMDRVQGYDTLVALLANGIVPEVIETDKVFEDYGPDLYESLTKVTQYDEFNAALAKEAA